MMQQSYIHEDEQPEEIPGVENDELSGEDVVEDVLVDQEGDGLATEVIEQGVNQPYGLQAQRACSYTHWYNPDKYVMTTATSTDSASVATPQMLLKEGLKVFGVDGMGAVKKEMQQLHDCKVMKSQKGKDLTPEQKQMAVAYLMFLKLTEFRQPIQVQSHLEMPGILVQLGCIQRT